jgi:Domain of unknown function (DUF4389)
MHATYPVSYSLDRPARFSRLQLAVRVVAFLALGVLGLSFGTVFFFGYLALPVFAAIRLARDDTAATYLTADGPRVVTALRWFAAISAWVSLLAEHLPARSPDETVALRVEPDARPTVSAAIWRVITGLPSAFVLALLGALGVLVWLWAALSVLITQEVGPGAFAYLSGVQRWSVRLLAYQASLVDEYPPFSFAAAPPPQLPTARVAT